MLPSRERARPVSDRSHLSRVEDVNAGTATRDAGTRHAVSGRALPVAIADRKEEFDN
jgi:hypothetical protein